MSSSLGNDGAVVTVRFDSDVEIAVGETDETTFTSAGEKDALLAGFGVDGEVLFAVTAGGAGFDSPDGVAVAGDIIVAVGRCEDGAVFGAGEPGETIFTSAGGRDAWVAGYGEDGTFLWLRTAGGAGDDGAEAIGVAPDGSLRVAGSYEDEAVFGSGEPNETIANSLYGDAFLMKLAL